MLRNHIYLIYIYKEDLALNNQQRLICHKTQPKDYSYWERLEKLGLTTLFERMRGDLIETFQNN